MTPRDPAAPGQGRDLARDFDSRSRGIALAGAILLGLAGVIGVAQDWIQHTREGIAGYRAWRVAGPPCPTMASAQGATFQPLQIVTFGGARFARAHGAVHCSDVATDHGWGFDLFPVCQFDHPGSLVVSTHGGLYRFSAGYLNPATISIEDGVPVCVIGASRDFGHRLAFDALGPRSALALR